MGPRLFPRASLRPLLPIPLHLHLIVYLSVPSAMASIYLERAYPCLQVLQSPNQLQVDLPLERAALLQILQQSHPLLHLYRLPLRVVRDLKVVLVLAFPTRVQVPQPRARAHLLPLALYTGSISGINGFSPLDRRSSFLPLERYCHCDPPGRVWALFKLPLYPLSLEKSDNDIFLISFFFSLAS